MPQYVFELVAAMNRHRLGLWPWAAFTHDVSRELYPSLHVHVPIFNATVDYLGQHRPLEANELFARQSLFSAVLDSKFAQGARELGYQVEYTDKGPELSSVPPAVRTQFSKGAAKIDAATKKVTGKARGHEAARPVLAWKVRAPKARALDEVALRRSWEDQLGSDRLTALSSVVSQPRQHGSVVEAEAPTLIPYCGCRDRIDRAPDHHPRSPA